MIDIQFSCPKCGNAEEDWLIWDENGERVTCVICKTNYRPGEPTPTPHSIILQELLTEKRRREFAVNRIRNYYNDR